MMLSKGIPTSPGRILNIVMTVLIITLFLHTIRLSSQTTRITELVVDVDTVPGGNGSPEQQYLSRLAVECNLTPQAQYHSWRIRPSEAGQDWSSLTDVHLNFAPYSMKVVNVDSPNPQDVRARRRMELPVHAGPLPGQTAAAEFLFGVSTTYERIIADDSAILRSWARWLTDGARRSNGASLIVMLVQATDSHVDEIDRKLQSAGIDAYVTTTEEPMSMARRYYELARILKSFGANLAANGQEKRWFGLIEDSIFFPSLAYLQSRLFSYDTEGQHYLGLPSERSDWDEEEYKMTTYGGGAVLMTRRAVSRIPSLPCFEQSSTGSAAFRAKQWDMLLQDCVMSHTELEMHVLPGFYSPNDDTYSSQVDSYEMGTPPLLLHKYADRHSLNVNKAHLVTNVCGEAGFMQRFLFHDNWVLVNGVSLTQYPDGIKLESKDSVGTMAKAESFTKRHRVPARVKIDDETVDVDRISLTPTGRRDVWKMMDSAIGKNGAVWQAYVKKATRTEALDSVIVLIWETAAMQETW